MTANSHKFLDGHKHMVVMNFIVLFFLGNHVSNALKNPDETSVVPNQVGDFIENSQQKKPNVSPIINQDPYIPEPMLLNLLMNKNRPNEINLRSAFMDYVFSLLLNKSLKLHVKHALNIFENSDEDKKVIITQCKELEEAESIDKHLKHNLVENKYHTMVKATQNNYKLLENISIVQKRMTKHRIDCSKVYRERQKKAESSTDRMSPLLKGVRVFLENESHEPGRKAVQKDVVGINYLSKESDNSFIADILNIGSLESTQELDINKQDSENVSSNISVKNKLKNEENSKNAIEIKNGLSSMKIHQLKNKTIFGYQQNLLILILNDSYKNHAPSNVLKTLIPKRKVKRSSPPASTKQLEVPNVGNFPFSTAGSSLYGSYAYANSRPSGFGMFPPFGVGGGEVGEPIVGDEGGEVVHPIGGEEEGNK